MKKFVCYKCNQEFSQKEHLKKHLNRIKSCQKCNNGFQTNYAYINDELTHIDDFKKGTKPFCRLKHELVAVQIEGERKSYFRHKNQGDIDNNNMSNFHIEWQRNFPEIEVWHPQLEGQLKARRADIVIKNTNFIVEIQHSIIKAEDVRCRKNDYKKHNKEIIWIIDGSGVKCEKLYYGGDTTGYLIKFDWDWKFKSFKEDYDFVLLDYYDKDEKINKIFKIPVKKVCNKFIKIKEYKTKEIVIETLLNNPVNIWNLFQDDNFCHSNLVISQKGAGNGKTFSTLKNMIENPNKDLFILLTPKHSEKDVILNELSEQIERKEYYLQDNIEHIDELMKNLEEKGGTKSRAAQYILRYRHKINNREITVIIATVQSFYFNITYINPNSTDPFSTLVPNFLENYYGPNNIPKINSRTGKFRFAKGERYLNKKTQIEFDEAQDLEIEHFDAMIKLMLNYGVDIGVVGDKLQSLKHEENFFTVLDDKKNELYKINITKNPQLNINRRIKVKGLHNIINQKLEKEFEKYNLPAIQVNTDKLDDVSYEPFETFSSDSLLSNEKDLDKVEKYCNEIIEKLEYEINTHYYLPQDILIISPILSGRTELIELKSKIQNMWIKFFNNQEYRNKIRNDAKNEWNGWKDENHYDSNKCVEYIVLHKSENGNAINLKESTYKTRIVSTITSKGDGRDVVFVLNTTEYTLKLVGDNKIGLKYSSSLHVSLTRAKKKLYFQVTQNGDHIHRKFNGHNGLFICPKISKTINITKLSENENYINDNLLSDLLKRNEIQYEKKQNEELSGYDFTEHCSRYASYKTILHFILNERNDKGSHIYNTYRDVFEIDIGKPRYPKDYWRWLNEETKDKENTIENISEIPVLNYDHKVYKGFSEQIIVKMKNIQKKLKKNYYKNIKNLKFSIEDILIISYMININRYKNKSPLSINEFYSILNRIKDDDKDTNVFYNKIIPIINKSNNMIDDIEEKYGELKWNMEKSISYKGETKNYELYKTPSFLIGQNNNYVIDILLKTSYTELNYLEVMKIILLDRFVIYNPKNTNNKDDRKKYFNKELITYILILEENNYIEFNWKWDKNNNEIKELINEAIFKYYKSLNNDFFYFIYCSIKSWNKGGVLKLYEWNEDNSIKSLKSQCSEFSDPFKYFENKIGKNAPDYLNKYIDFIKKRFKENKNKFKQELFNDNYKNSQEENIKIIDKLLEDNIDEFFETIEF